MSAVWGSKLSYTIFGESHGSGIGMVIAGLPPGVRLDMEQIDREMSRRAPGKNEFSTPRSESDKVAVISGLYQGCTDGSPLCAMIKNNDTRSADYAEQPRIFRPGHADFSGYVKYGGNNDPRGGGHFSGRLTAPLVFAGAIAKQLLAERGIVIGAHILQIGSARDRPFDPVSLEGNDLSRLSKLEFPTLDTAAADAMRAVMSAAKEQADSVGGVVEAAACGLPPGLGDPFFDSVESVLAHLLFSIPAVKGVEFGSGFQLAAMNGSQANDKFVNMGGLIKTATNHNGGILGGITTGMPLVFRAAFKPTPSIGQKQETVDSKGCKVELMIKGRHDPCIVPRAVPVVEAVTAMAIWDLL